MKTKKNVKQIRHRSRKNRLLARKDGNKPLNLKFQKEIRKFTTAELRELGIQKPKDELHWVCADCHCPKGHDKNRDPPCRFDPGRRKLRVKVKRTKKQPLLMDMFQMGSKPTMLQSNDDEIVPDQIDKNGDDIDDAVLAAAADEAEKQYLAKQGTQLRDSQSSDVSSSAVDSESETSCERSAIKESREDSMSYRISDYANAVFDTLIRPLISKQSGRVCRAVLLQNKIRNWIFPFPKPEFLYKKHLKVGDKKVDYSTSNEAYALSDSVLVVLDYELFFPSYFSHFSCHCGKKLTRNGYTNYCRAERAFGIGRVFKTVEYRCEECLDPQPGFKSSSYTTLSEEIIAQLSPVIRSSLDFVVGGLGYIVSRSTCTQVMSMVMNGSSYLGIEKISREAVQTELGYKERTRLETILHRIHTSSTEKLRCLDRVSMVHYYPVFALSSTIAENVYLAEQNRVKSVMEASFPNASLGESQLQGDMNFPWGNDGSSTGMCGLYHVFTMHGLAVAGQGLTTKSLDEAVPIFEKIAQFKKNNKDTVPINQFWSDQPKIDTKSLRKGFGDNIIVRKDVFHVEVKIGKIAKAGHPLRPSFLAKVSSCFFEYFSQDMDRLRQKHLRDGMNNSDIERLLGNPFYVSKQQSIRTKLRQGKQIVSALKEIFSQFQGHNLFLPGAWEVMDSLYPTIEAHVGEHLDDSTPVWVNIGSEENPVWIVCRGTNMVENYHRYNKSLKLFRFAHESANAIYVRSLWSFSHRQRVSRLQQDLLEYVYDPVLMNELVILQSKAQEYIAFPRILTSHAVLCPLEPSEYLAGIVVPNRTQALTQAVENFSQRREEYETDEPLQVSRRVIFSACPHETATPFPARVDHPELRLLRALVLSKEYFTAKASEFHNSALEEALWCKLNEKARDYVCVDNLTRDWNEMYFDALCEDRPVRLKGLIVETKHISTKTSFHILKGIESISHAIVVGLRRKEHPEVRPNVVTTSVPPSEANSTKLIIPMAEVNLSEAALSLASSEVVPSVHSSDLNRTFHVPVPKRQRAPRLASNSNSAPPQQPSSPELNHTKRKRAGCPISGCKRGRHDDLSCPFAAWCEEQQKLPKGHSEKIKRQGKESLNDALRRVYSSRLASSVI